MSLLLKIFIISIIILLKISSHEIVSIPFNSYFNNKNNNKYNISSLDDLARIYLFTKISIGEPSYEIQAFLSFQHAYFSVSLSGLTAWGHNNTYACDVIRRYRSLLLPRQRIPRLCR